MASFVGSKKEFHRYVGPRLRNVVNQITRSHKLKVANCEHCDSAENLESAHIKGRERVEIIDLILKDFTYDGVVTIELGMFELKFKKEHTPIEKNILVLCKDCHRKYDSEPIELDTQNSNDDVPIPGEPQEQISHSGSLPITLDPPVTEDFKQRLLATRMAEIEVTFDDGRIERRNWDASRFSISSNVFGNLRSRPEFRPGAWQDRGIQKVHVKIIDSDS